MTRYIIIKLTEDQLNHIMDTLNLTLLEAQHKAKVNNFSLDTNDIAFHKRLMTTLAKAKS